MPFLLKLGSAFSFSGNTVIGKRKLSAWNLSSREDRETGGVETLPFLPTLGFEFSLFGIGEKRKLSASRPDMSSQELMTSGRVGTGLGSDQRDLDSLKVDPEVKDGCGEGGVVVECDGGSRVSSPYVVEVRETMWLPNAELPS